MRQRTPGGSPNINDKESCDFFVYKEGGEKTSNFKSHFCSQEGFNA